MSSSSVYNQIFLLCNHNDICFSCATKNCDVQLFHANTVIRRRLQDRLLVPLVSCVNIFLMRRFASCNGCQTRLGRITRSSNIAFAAERIRPVRVLIFNYNFLFEPLLHEDIKSLEISSSSDENTENIDPNIVLPEMLMATRSAISTPGCSTDSSALPIHSSGNVGFSPEYINALDNIFARELSGGNINNLVQTSLSSIVTNDIILASTDRTDSSALLSSLDNSSVADLSVDISSLDIPLLVEDLDEFFRQIEE